MMEIVSAWLYYLAVGLIPYGLPLSISSKRLFIIYTLLITICLMMTLPYLHSAWKLKDPIGIPYLHVLSNIYAYALLGILIKMATLYFEGMQGNLRQIVIYSTFFMAPLLLLLFLRLIYFCNFC
jgi:hypothetical protein